MKYLVIAYQQTYSHSYISLEENAYMCVFAVIYHSNFLAFVVNIDRSAFSCHPYMFMQVSTHNI